MTPRKPLPAATTEAAPAKVLPGLGNSTSHAPSVAVAVQPTQLRRPGRTTLRSAFQMFVALCALAPILVAELHLDPAKLPWLVVPLAIAATVTRVMAIPQVEKFLRRFFPWLAAAPK